MKLTYKLDEKGIPYRILTGDSAKEQKKEQEAELIPHNGALCHFHLYALSF